MKFYKLDEDKEISECSCHEWTTSRKRVGYNEIDDYIISTIFLGIDHNFDPDESGPPVLFETMVFDIRGENIYMERYCTYKEAKVGHERAIQWVKDGCKEDEI